MWKQQLQEFANEEDLTITVAHYPPATSKWNKIEHRLFSFISINWRAKPLISLEVVVEVVVAVVVAVVSDALVAAVVSPPPLGPRTTIGHELPTR